MPLSFRKGSRETEKCATHRCPPAFMVGSCLVHCDVPAGFSTLGPRQIRSTQHTCHVCGSAGSSFSGPRGATPRAAQSTPRAGQSTQAAQRNGTGGPPDTGPPAPPPPAGRAAGPPGEEASAPWAPLHALPTSQTVAFVAAMKNAACIKMIVPNTLQCIYHGRNTHDSSIQDRVENMLCNVS